MESNQTHVTAQDEAYLEIWKTEQEYVRTRWTITTFFMGISFAVSGFSFQSSITQEKAVIIRFAGLVIYWFSYLLFWNFYAYTKFLRNYLVELESSGQTSLNIQSKTEIALRPAHGKKQFSTQLLLIVFGAIYSVGVLMLWILGV